MAYGSRRAPAAQTGLILGAFLLALAMAGCGRPRTAQSDAHSHADEDHVSPLHTDVEAGVFTSHIHGVGFSEGGEAILVATHEGIAAFRDGSWSAPNVPSHDYMGFAPTHAGFYASGHPDHSTDLPDPLGLVQVTKNGSELEMLAFGGELDFHLLAAGFFNRTIYVINEEPATNLPAGLHFSQDDGRTWRLSLGLIDIPPARQLAVHPTDAGRVAVLTDEGVYLSDDHGEHFRRLPTGFVPTAVALLPDKDVLVYAGQALVFHELSPKSRPVSHPSPIPVDDTAAYLAVAPTASEEIVLVTRRNAIYRSVDGGIRWNQIAVQGLDAAPDAAKSTQDCDCGP